MKVGGWAGIADFSEGRMCSALRTAFLSTLIAPGLTTDIIKIIMIQKLCVYANFLRSRFSSLFLLSLFGFFRVVFNIVRLFSFFAGECYFDGNVRVSICDMCVYKIKKVYVCILNSSKNNFDIQEHENIMFKQSHGKTSMFENFVLF